MIVESCCASLDEALSAEARGAGRIEICADLSVGGVTPPRELIREVVSRLSIPVNVLIRPSAPRRSQNLFEPAGAFGSDPLVIPGSDRASEFACSDFVCDEDSLQQMIDDISYCKRAGAAGIVIGALTPEGAIDLPAMRRLVAAAQPFPVTFHRAFDVCTEDPFIALDKIISLGCARLLTSGHAPTAWEGRNLIRLLVRRAGGRIIIMPGRGVTPSNLAALATATQATEFHGTAIP